MSRVHRANERLYRWFLKLTPAQHRRRHGDEQLRLFADLLQSGHRPGRLWLQAIPDLYTVHRSSTSNRSIMSHLPRLALYPLSILNLIAGVTLATVALVLDDVPAWVALPALCVAIQGGYTLAWLRERLLLRRLPVDRVPRLRRLGSILFATGEAVALVAATAGIIAAVIRQSGSSDPEYGPPTIMAMVAVHAIVGLLARYPPSEEHASAEPGVALG